MNELARFLDPGLLQRLNQLQLSARSVVEGTTSGLHRSRVKGASVDFRQHRSYVPGDEPRRLDWRLLARTDRPFVREYHEETNLHALLMLDTSGSMNYGRRFGSKFRYASQIVASLAYLMLSQTESVGITLFGQRVHNWLAPHSLSTQLSRIVEILEGARPSGPSAADVAMHDSADRLQRRSLVILLSDFFVPIDRLRHGLARLRHERHEVIAMQILEPDELEFPFQSFARFRGLEGESSSIIDAAILRQTYLSNLEAHQHGLTQACRTLGVEHVRMTIDQPLEESLFAFLRRRTEQQ